MDSRQSAIMKLRASANPPHSKAACNQRLRSISAGLLATAMKGVTEAMPTTSAMPRMTINAINQAPRLFSRASSREKTLKNGLNISAG